MATLNSNVLTTLARTKVFLGAESTDRYDTLLTQLINQVTGFVERYCKRTFKSTAYSNEVYDGKGSNILILKNFPVTALSSLQEDQNNDGEANWQTVDTDYYKWYSDGRIVAVTFQFQERPQKYRASYTAGYLIDFSQENNTAAHTLPPELEYAVHKLVSAVFNNRKGEGLERTQIGDQSVVFQKTVFDSQEVRAILDKYAAPTV